MHYMLSIASTELCELVSPRFQLMVSGHKRNWMIELGMFLFVITLTTLFLVIYVIVEIY